MSDRFDLVIRGGLVVDGTGAEPFAADIGVIGESISAVGPGLAAGAEEIDARDRIVTPGFVDLHTHYDAQVTWAERVTPSSVNGVTTVVMGNCGVGFAPCRESDRNELISLMSGVEDIPEIIMADGLPWTWTTFAEYLDAVDARPHDVDIAALIPHSALRVFVMGARAIAREVARPDDLARMAALAKEAMAAGAAGFATSRSIHQRSAAGEPIPTVRAGEDELQAIAAVLGAAGRGVFQVLSDFDEQGDIAGEFDMFRRLTRTSGRPLMFTLHQKNSHPEDWRDLLALTEAANDEGLPIWPQVHSRPTSVLLGFELSLTPFTGSPSYEALRGVSFAARLAALRDPQVRARILAEAPQRGAGRKMAFDRIFPLGDPPNYEPLPQTSLASQAQARGLTSLELAYDLMLENGGRGVLLSAFQNYAYGCLEPTRELMGHRDTLVALGDGGAHVGLVCDASYPTTMLEYWTRERRRGERFSLPWAVKAMTFDTARAIGLSDRGVVRAGLRADLNVIDYDGLTQRAPQVVHDLPTGGRRIVQDADGYVATVLRGQVTYREGEPTGPLPGRVIRFA